MDEDKEHRTEGMDGDDVEKEDVSPSGRARQKVRAKKEPLAMLTSRGRASRRASIRKRRGANATSSSRRRAEKNARRS
jgi:hypothetical protein